MRALIVSPNQKHIDECGKVVELTYRGCGVYSSQNHDYRDSDFVEELHLASHKALLTRSSERIKRVLELIELHERGANENTETA